LLPPLGWVILLLHKVNAMTTIDRRLFLKSVSAAGLAAGAWLGQGDSPIFAARESGQSPAAAGGEPALKRKFTMCLSCGMIGVGADQREAIRLASRFGFEAVDPNGDFLARLPDGQLQELLADLQGKKLVWGSAGLPVDFRGEEAAFTAGMKRLAELAKGVKRAGVTRFGTWLSPSHGTLSYEANFAQHARRLREVAKVLGDHAQRLGLEYVGPKTSWARGRFPFIHTMAKMKELIAEIGRDNVGLMLDSWHWYTAHETVADLLSLRNSDVVCCHLNDAPKGIPVDEQVDGRRALPCATGVIDLKGFLGGLVKIGYDGPIAAEPFDRTLAKLPKDDALVRTAAAMKTAFALVP
jgi:sugar phosphate isomerase/epimerase